MTKIEFFQTIATNNEKEWHVKHVNKPRDPHG